MRFRSRSAQETQVAARELAACVSDAGLVVALVGPLGAGKTVFVRGLAEGLGVDPALVASPSFVLASEYPGLRPFAHVDLYRVETEAELLAAGFLDLLEPGAVVAVEWGDRLPDALPTDHLQVTITPARQNRGAGEPDRTLEAHARGPVSSAALARWSARLAAARRAAAESRPWA